MPNDRNIASLSNEKASDHGAPFKQANRLDCGGNVRER